VFTDVSAKYIGHIFKVQAAQNVHVFVFGYPKEARETL
jgi:hypothetical protein